MNKGHFDHGWSSNNYRHGYHLFRAISLLALMIEHNMVWINRYKQISLEALQGFSWLSGFLSVGTYFIALGGASFAMQLQPNFKNGRLQKVRFGALGHYLIALICIDTIRDIWTFERISLTFEWSFLKTLFVGYLVAQILARIHIAMVPLAAFLLAGYGSQLTNFFFTKLTLSDTGSYLRNSEYTLIVHSLHYYFLFGWLLFLIYQSKFSRVTKLLLSLFASLSVGYLFWSLRSRAFDLEEYLHAKNFLIYALVGRPKYQGVTFYSLNAWLPTVLNGFALGYFVMRPAVRRFFEKNWISVFAMSFAVAFVLAYRYQHGVQEIRQNLVEIWNTRDFTTTSPLTELLKISATLFFGLAFSTIARFLSAPRIWPWIERISGATFPIYLLLTSVAVPISRHIAPRFDFATGTLLLTLVMILFAVGVAYISGVIQSKKIKVVITKVTPPKETDVWQSSFFHS